MDNTNYLLTSESVSEGHPDKMADQISDGILDALLAQDPMSRVACETSVTTGLVLVFGEIRQRPMSIFKKSSAKPSRTSVTTIPPTGSIATDARFW